uniref:Uncharacterized protein n=1 Tax=Plectus sambesii TaxID=2011161 RepID=A0A914WNS4_9BILA
MIELAVAPVRCAHRDPPAISLIDSSSPVDGHVGARLLERLCAVRYGSRRHSTPLRRNRSLVRMRGDDALIKTDVAGRCCVERLFLPSVGAKAPICWSAMRMDACPFARRRRISVAKGDNYAIVSRPQPRTPESPSFAPLPFVCLDLLTARRS